jgi:hypothetical protein
VWPFTKSLDQVLFPQKKIRILGVSFTIKKLNPLDWMDGSKVMLSVFEEYKVSPEKMNAESTHKIKSHYVDMFMSSVVLPKLKRKESDTEGLWVDHIFTNWEIANQLYTEICNYTYGKKKGLLNTLLNLRS